MLPFLEPDLTLSPGVEVHFQPRRLKRDLSPPQFIVPYEAVAGNPVHALALYLRVCRCFGQPIQDVLARVLTSDRRAFQEKCMGSSQLTARLKAHFAAVGVAYSVTTHGGRRGAIQALTQDGMESSTVGELAQIRTPAVRVCYEDAGRHIPCRVARVGKSAKTRYVPY